MTIKSRIQKLETRHVQAEQKIYIVAYGDNGRGIPPSSKELIGMTEPEVSAFIGDGENVILIHIVRASDANI